MLPQLRANSIMPRLVNTDYSAAAAQPGTTIRIPTVPTATVAAITPAATPPANTDTTYASVDVALDQWYGSEFYLTDKDKHEIQSGILPRRAEASLTAITDHIDNAILVAGAAFASRALGTAGTAPFATLPLAVDTMTQLSINKASKMGRHVVTDPIGSANVLSLTSFQESSFVGDVTAMTDGAFNGNRRIGAQWWEDQNAGYTHTAGGGTGYLSNLGATLPIGSTSIILDTGGGTTTVLAGDVVTFAGDANQYVVTTGIAAATGTITIGAPGLRQTLANNVAMTIVSVGSTHKKSLAFQRDAIVFASRPQMPSDATATMQALSDPISGLSINMEVSRQHYQDKWSLSVLYGTKGIESRGILQILG